MFGQTLKTTAFPSSFLPFLNGEVDHLRVFKSGPASQALAASELAARGRGWIMVVPSSLEFREAQALLSLFLPPASPTAPTWEKPWVELGPHLPGTPHPSQWGPRMAALYALVYGARGTGLLLTVDNLLPLWPALGTLEAANLTLAKGEEVSMELVMDQAVAWGYEARPLVDQYGDMAVRGDIMDIFAPGYTMPLRLEFFGDVLEEIRLFDPSTQRSKQDLVEAVLLPVSPAVMLPSRMDEARDWWRDLRSIGELGTGEEHDLLRRLDESDGFFPPGLFSKNAVHLEEYFPKGSTFILCSAGSLRHKLEDGEGAWASHLEKQAADTGIKWPRHLVMRVAETARKAWTAAPQLVFEDLTIGVERRGVDLAETPISSFGELFWRPEETQRPWTALLAGLKKWKKAGESTILSFRNPRSRTRFLKLAEEAALDIATEPTADLRGILALISPLRKGMELAWRGMRILSEDVLQPEKMAAPGRSAKDFKGLARYDDLADGDLLVHRDYGLARFAGLHHMDVGPANDYLLLHFDGDDRLYLPVDRINLVQRYKGPEGASPALDRLGGGRWNKATEKARKAIEKIARDLVEMYARRKVSKGYSYGPPDELYREFESTFGFDETPDQEKAVRDVLLDMSLDEPMDRLVCGDVGFGKTEVALRAAFRAACEGKQVALLCPTTVLAEQHYQTFRQRMEPFPVKVAMLSRFVPKARQKTILEAARRGEVDVLIGTHRLLSKDVELPNLGLMILDEEQRFGVKHKERMKKMRQDIDVLALTATPIPRTLQLSLSGIRKLSVIETPPLDRKPVETALVERDEAMLRTVLKRELERGGQVFWVHNRVQGLARVTEFVAKLAPDARIGMAHGQMNERELEDTIHGFWHRELDILVCTAIIESGLDFPNANTLIVDQAQMFGLGQLYQLRGRVGRSERQAYAYFVVPSLDQLPQISKRRLRIILDMDYLGAGFKVAMEDLRLRGAGNILGEVQSGQIARVGLDLFLEMLEEEVRRIRGEAPRSHADPELSLLFAAHLPAGYIPDARERLHYYRALSTASGEVDRVELAAELRDRFGPLPEPVANFMAVLALKETLKVLSAARAELFPGRASISWDAEGQGIPAEHLLEWIEPRERMVRLKPPGTVEIRFPKGATVPDGIEFVRAELDALVRMVAPGSGDTNNATDMEGE